MLVVYFGCLPASGYSLPSSLAHYLFSILARDDEDPVLSDRLLYLGETKAFIRESYYPYNCATAVGARLVVRSFGPKGSSSCCFAKGSRFNSLRWQLKFFFLLESS